MDMISVEESLEDSDDNSYDQLTPYERFDYALRSPEVKRQYPKILKIFLDHIKFELERPLHERANLLYTNAFENRKWLESNIFRFILYQRRRVELKEIAAGTLKNHLKVIKVFCRMNDLEDQIGWSKIKIGMPKVKEVADDRPPTIEEIKKLLEYDDPRIKPIVLIMLSSGIRLGAFDFLKWKHVTPRRDKEGNLTSAKMLVYAGEPEEYYSFITLEAYNALKDWMDLRKRHGENIDGNSWIVRDLWKTRRATFDQLQYQASNPNKFNSGGIKTLLSRAWHHVGVWNSLKDGEKRHEFKLAHGFRKFFETRTQQLMNHNNVKILMGHTSSMGISRNYYKPTEQEVLQDYLKAVELLTIGEENKLKSKINELTEKDKVQEYIINKKLMEKESEIEKLTQQNVLTTDTIANLSDQLTKLFVEVEKLKKNG
jgi:hypothetical protein